MRSYVAIIILAVLGLLTGAVRDGIGAQRNQLHVMLRSRDWIWNPYYSPELRAIGFPNLRVFPGDRVALQIFLADRDAKPRPANTPPLLVEGLKLYLTTRHRFNVDETMSLEAVAATIERDLERDTQLRFEADEMADEMADARWWGAAELAVELPQDLPAGTYSIIARFAKPTSPELTSGADQKVGLTGQVAMVYGPPRTEQESLYVLYRQAVLANRVGKHAEATLACRALLARAPFSALAWGTLGRAEAAAGNKKEAIEAFNRAISLVKEGRDGRVVNESGGEMLDAYAWENHVALWEKFLDDLALGRPVL